MGIDRRSKAWFTSSHAQSGAGKEGKKMKETAFQVTIFAGGAL
jgi:hypothetical protein